MNTTTTPTITAAAYLLEQLPDATPDRRAAFSAYLSRFRAKFPAADTTHPRRYLYTRATIAAAFTAWQRTARKPRPKTAPAPLAADPLEQARQVLTIYTADRPAGQHGYAIISPSFPTCTGTAPTLDKAITRATKLARAMAVPATVITY